MSLILPSLQELAATEQGIGLIFQLLLQLPVNEFRYFPAFRKLPENDLSLLAEPLLPLGRGFIVGDRVRRPGGSWLEVGPFALETYYEYQKGREEKVVHPGFGFVHELAAQVPRVVGSAGSERVPRLGYEAQNARLGINSHLGQLERI